MTSRDDGGTVGPSGTLGDAAAKLLATDPARAADLYEEACEFGAASRAATVAGDLTRALRLAALAGDDALAASAADAVVAAKSTAVAIGAAHELLSRGLSRHAALLFDRLAQHADAARAYAAAGDAAHSARSWERAGKPAEAARVLETTLAGRAEDDALRWQLARLLARHGRTEPAVRAMQRLALGSDERRRSLPLLARCLAELGLEDAARTVRLEAEKLGVVEEPDEAPEVEKAPDAPPSDARSVPAPTASGPGIGALLFGRYEVVREVAQTPNARVVEAIDRVGGGRVAVKLLGATAQGAGRDALLRFEREARALAMFRHPHVAPLVEYLPDRPAMVLAWMPGGSLADLEKREPIAPARAVEIMSAVLAALGEAHRLGILHRDVKPSNVLFDDVGSARLADFGAAHLGDLSTTATAGAIGTFAYMSPEQRLGRPATVQSDVFGVGAMLYELLTGLAAEPAVHGRLATPPSGAHPDLDVRHDAVVAQLLEEDPRERPGDAFEARRLLGSVPWSARVVARAAVRPTTERPPASGRVGRIAPALDVGDGRDAALRYRDTWLARDVLVVPIDDATLARARAFARAGHAALAAVLAADAKAGAIWIEAPRGRSLADAPRALSPGHVARLRDALGALHAAGGAHGAIDVEHVYLHDGDVLLAWPRRAGGSADDDLAALERLTG